MTRTLDVGLDLDGCKFWFDRAYYAGCIKAGLLPADTAHITADVWTFYESYGHDLPTFLANCDRLADLGLLWDGDMIPGAKTAWEALADAGHRIHVITDRSFGSHPIASEVGTRMWLARHGVRYTSLTFSADKTVVPTDVMLEDKLANYDALAETSCIPVLINRPWNHAPDGDARMRVDTHDEFVALVAAMAEDTVDA